jgi:predicted DNA-binding transcriptional regulator AlpA
MSSDSKDRMLPTRLVCERYNITDRTVDRWLENGILPSPVRINGLRYWHQRELEQRERDFQQDDARQSPPNRSGKGRDPFATTELRQTRRGARRDRR